MTFRTTTDQSEHDAVVSASSKTYGEMQKKGYKVSINRASEKNQYIGSESNPHYPDVVVWMPAYEGATRGTPTIIEEIETAESITDSEASQWKNYGSFGIKFLLVVPKGYCTEVLKLVAKHGVNVSELWYYYFEYDGTIKFEKYR